MDIFSRHVNRWGSEQQPTTAQESAIQVLLYEDKKRRWNEEKDGKETTTTLIAVNEMILYELNQAINHAMDDLVQLVERYDRLSLVGSCSAQVRSAVRFLEAMGEIDIGQDELANVKKSLEHLKRKLELLNEIEEIAKKGMSG